VLTFARRRFDASLMRSVVERGCPTIRFSSRGLFSITEEVAKTRPVPTIIFLL
jgi:hypothetical protein